MWNMRRMLSDGEISRFWTFVPNRPENPKACWLWEGQKTNGGYGLFSFKCRSELAHRIAWLIAKKEIKNGFQINHRPLLCSNPSCVRFSHLYEGTQQENIQDAMVEKKMKNLFPSGPSHPQAQKTHCPRGHEYTDKNTYRFKSDGNRRRCKTCVSERRTRGL